MSKIGQYIIDNNIITDYGWDVGTPSHPEDDFEYTEGDKVWDSVQEWKDLFKDDPVLF